MLHRFPVLWNGHTLVGFLILSVIALCIGDLIASSTTGADGEEELESRLPNVNYFLRPYLVPNYWISYEGSAIFDAIQQKPENLMPLLYSSIFNAAFATPAVNCALLCAVIVSYRRAFHIDHIVHVVYLLPIGAFFADLIEDVLLCFITALFPVRADKAMEVTAAMSSAKFFLWALSAIAILIAILWRFIFGPPKSHSKSF
jgi:hypothetical protein